MMTSAQEVTQALAELKASYPVKRRLELEHCQESLSQKCRDIQEQMTQRIRAIEDATVWYDVKESPLARDFWSRWLYSVIKFIVPYVLNMDCVHELPFWRASVYRDPLNKFVHDLARPAYAWGEDEEPVLEVPALLFPAHGTLSTVLTISRYFPQVSVTFLHHAIWRDVVDHWMRELPSPVHIYDRRGLEDLPARHRVLQHIPEVLQVRFDETSGLTLDLFIPRAFRFHQWLSRNFPQALIPLMLSFHDATIAEHWVASQWILKQRMPGKKNIYRYTHGRVLL